MRLARMMRRLMGDLTRDGFASTSGSLLKRKCLLLLKAQLARRDSSASSRPSILAHHPRPLGTWRRVRVIHFRGTAEATLGGSPLELRHGRLEAVGRLREKRVEPLRCDAQLGSKSADYLAAIGPHVCVGATLKSVHRRRRREGLSLGDPVLKLLLLHSFTRLKALSVRLELL